MSRSHLSHSNKEDFLGYERFFYINLTCNSISYFGKEYIWIVTYKKKVFLDFQGMSGLHEFLFSFTQL